MSYRTPASWVATQCLVVLGVSLCSVRAYAHEPIFSPGPHTVFAHGLELGTSFDYAKEGGARLRSQTLHLGYGITPDLEVGLEQPFVDNSYGRTGPELVGAGDPQFYAHWRYWRDDEPGYQDAAGVLVDVKPDRVGRGLPPARATGSRSTLLGLDVSHEGLKWYRWASAYYEHNGTNGAGYHYGDRSYLNLVGGWRPKPPSFTKPDTVWMLELDTVHARADTEGPVPVANTGGTQAFLAPGVMWTVRNFAIRAGIQLPIYSRMNGSGAGQDYHARLDFEWDFAAI